RDPDQDDRGARRYAACHAHRTRSASAPPGAPDTDGGRPVPRRRRRRGHARMSVGLAGPALVTGGAGFLGINLVRYLLRAGVAVRALDLAPFDYPERDAVEVVSGDVRDAACVSRAMAGASV